MFRRSTFRSLIAPKSQGQDERQATSTSYQLVPLSSFLPAPTFAYSSADLILDVTPCLPPKVWQRKLYTFVPAEDNYETESWDMQQLDTNSASQPNKQLKTNEVRSCMPTGWHFGAWIATLQAGVVLLINIITLLVCLGKTGGSIGIAQIFEGDCNTVDHATLGIHLVINVLSTLLLSASNYVMQSLSAPTRNEVDRAHKKGFWLDIGLQSMHNLKRTRGWKRLLWTLLSISSIPLHLFYNSSFFSTISANDYNWYIAQGPEMQDLSQSANLTFNWDFLVLNDGPSGQLSDFMGAPQVPFGWICGGTGGIQQSFADSSTPCSTEWTQGINPSNWTMEAGIYFDSTGGDDIISGSLPVQYCLSETTASRCQLQFNLPLLAIVVAFNIVKVICMAIVATKMHDNPLVTLGDAIASFSNSPEPLTKEMCLVSQSYLEKLDKNKATPYPYPSPGPLVVYQPQKTSWMSTVSRRHWILICSLLCTKLFLALEWSSYARTRKPLRVSDPHGDQRSTYFLNIPFRFGIPLMVYSALLHWLLSQSIFVVAVTFWDGDLIDTSNSITTCGYSPAAMILTAIAGGSLILSSLVVGCFKHLKSDMPLVGSCSKAIAAACHPPEDGSDPLKPMKWGVVPKSPNSSNPATGHISFSSGEVSAPVPGRYYL
ncbi:hypothetical protein BDP27DRAFT_1485813 [Rhodocollybia butyracea]|uniref:DUF6536 domain-containing protein n=1 Tax=Rhodocollybia butyracea TaxID=206335 RepID=A0A9P5U1J1_9AGAR|nr:hypothetical protein BDP27DRAFT_1485813 [Rhodocollybia butyracea]